MNMEQVLKEPVLTEKSTTLAQSNVYMFKVAIDANKHQITEALEKLYKVKVDKVRIVIREGKTRRAGRKMQYKKLSDSKIAFITLKEGKIEIFPQ